MLTKASLLFRAIYISVTSITLIAQVPANPLEVMVHNQKKIEPNFVSVNAIFSEDKFTSPIAVKEYVSNASFLVLNKVALKNMVRQKSNGINIQLPDVKGIFLIWKWYNLIFCQKDLKQLLSIMEILLTPIMNKVFIILEQLTVILNR